MTDLKPCPFCGGEVNIAYSSMIERHYVFHEKRNKCIAEEIVLNRKYKSLGEAYKAWNRSVSDATD